MVKLGVPTTTAAFSSFHFPPTPPPNTPPPLPISTATVSSHESTSATEIVAPSPMPSAEVSSCLLNDGSRGETSTCTAFDDTEYVAMTSTPPTRTPTLGQIPSETPDHTPSTPRRCVASPFTSYSPYKDAYSPAISIEDTSSLYSLSSPNNSVGKATGYETKSPRPKACFNKENLRTKKIDSVEASFVTLSSVLHNHFTKSVQKHEKAKGPADGEEAFGNFIAVELKKMDNETRKQKSHAFYKSSMNK